MASSLFLLQYYELVLSSSPIIITANPQRPNAGRLVRPFVARHGQEQARSPNPPYTITDGQTNGVSPPTVTTSERYRR